MFARAVQEHNSATNLQLQRISDSGKQTIPSSKPTAAPNPPRQDIILKPNRSGVLNTSRESAFTSSTNPLKRTACQIASATASRRLQRNTMSKQPITYTSSGIVNKLHQGAFFDENDFVDDDDIDLDHGNPDSIQYPSLQSGSLPLVQHQGSDHSIAYPQLPSEPNLPIAKRKSPERSTALSNSLIEWSSSPLSHKTPLPRSALLQRAGTTDETATETNEVAQSNAGPRPSKRRTLPWLNKNTNEQGQESLAHKHGDKVGSSNGQLNDAAVRSGEQYTPLTKNTTGASHPWNKTASAIKEEQKRHRQKGNQGKKLTKQVDEGGKVVTKRKLREKTVARVFLSDEQKRVLNLVVEDQKSVFFTGSAGTGKSVLMREIITDLRKKYRREPDRVAVTASTGLAACNIGGVTLHSFSGIGLGKEAAEELVKKIKRNPKAKNRWLRTKVLIIDEISMVDGTLFDKLEKIARAIRNNGRPFGGMQLVVTGDFFQLPPVPDFGREATFAFDAATWSTSLQHTIGLTQVFRQKDPSKICVALSR